MFRSAMLMLGGLLLLLVACPLHSLAALRPRHHVMTRHDV